jgi:hypothetical protein
MEKTLDPEDPEDPFAILRGEKFCSHEFSEFEKDLREGDCL